MNLNTASENVQTSDTTNDRGTDWFSQLRRGLDSNSTAVPHGHWGETWFAAARAQGIEEGLLEPQVHNQQNRFTRDVFMAPPTSSGLANEAIAFICIFF